MPFGGSNTIYAWRPGDPGLQAIGTSRPVVRTAGRPADIAVDTRRNRVAVPFVALDQVEIWQLPR